MSKILIVEDYSVLSRMYQAKFSEDGYQVEAALNGEEGLAKAREFKPDLILLDIMMPKMSGLELLEVLKNDLALKGTPVILLTNVGGSQEVIERGLELGAIAYLVKTDYSPRQVVDLAEECLISYGQRIPEVKESAEQVKKKAEEKLEKEGKMQALELEVLTADARLDQARRRVEETEKKIEVLRKSTTPREAMEIMEAETAKAVAELEAASQRAQKVARKLESSGNLAVDIAGDKVGGDEGK